MEVCCYGSSARGSMVVCVHVSRVSGCAVGGQFGGFPALVLAGGAACSTLVCPVRTCSGVCARSRGAGLRGVHTRGGAPPWLECWAGPCIPGAPGGVRLWWGSVTHEAQRLLTAVLAHLVLGFLFCTDSGCSSCVLDTLPCQ